MLDFGWSELLMVVVVAVVAIGPKDMPALLYNLGRIVRRLQYMRFALTSRFEEFMEEIELSEKAKGRKGGVNFEAADAHASDFDEAEADEQHVIQESKAPVQTLLPLTPQDHESKS